MIEKLMEFCPAVFNDRIKTNVRKLMDALGSNLHANNPVRFDWNQQDMDYLYGQGQYMDHNPRPAEGAALDANIFDDDHLIQEVQHARPDGLRDPEAFQQALDKGEINRRLVEDVQACVLTVGMFYIQRATDWVQPFALVKVVRVIMNDDGKTQWGAYIHPWESSTSGDALDYFTDPWHASGAHNEAQRYKSNLDIHAQTWDYPKSTLVEFQDPVVVNQNWTKPRYNTCTHNKTTCAVCAACAPKNNRAPYRNTTYTHNDSRWKGTLRTLRGVKKRNINHASIPKVRKIVFRWSEDNED